MPAPERFAPEGFKPKVYVPAEILFERKYPKFKKTSRMGRAEYEFNTPIGDLLNWFYVVQGRSMRETAGILRISTHTLNRWINTLAIERRGQKKAS